MVVHGALNQKKDAGQDTYVRFVMTNDVHVMVTFGFGLLGTGLMFLCAGSVSVGWTVATNDKLGIETGYGLFRYASCSKVTGCSNTYEQEEVPALSILVVRILVVIGTLQSMAALMIGITLTYWNKHLTRTKLLKNNMKKLLPGVVAGASVAALVFILIGVVAWECDVHPQIEASYNRRTSTVLTLMDVMDKNQEENDSDVLTKEWITTLNDFTRFSLGYSYGLTIVSSILIAIGGVLVRFGVNK